MSITHTLARIAANLPSHDVPEGVRDRALALLTDLIGSVIRASNESESTPSIIAMVNRLGLAGEGQCSVFGLSRRYAPAAAALLNGAFGHSLDFDDTHSASSLHPSAPVVPAALAAAEMVDASGQDFLAAIVIGIEVCCRLGLALDPAAHYARGFHPTATAGIFGAAAAAGRLLGLDAGQMEAAFGIAASQASGSLQFLENGGWNKRYQVGEAAMKGLIAATLAAEGFVGATDALDGKHGFLKGYSDGARPELAVADLGTVWETMNVGIKPYPACRYTHAAVDGLLALQKEQGWTPHDITAITIGLHRNGIALVGTPLEAKQKAVNIVDGQFSMPFAAAVALLRGRFGWDDYDLLGSPEAEAIAARVAVRRDESLEGLRHPFGATLEVTARGQTFYRRIAAPSGEPETFPDAEACADKFRTLAAPVLNEAADVWLDRLGRLPDAPSIRQLFL